MKELRALRDHLQRQQEKQNELLGVHQPIMLTVSTLAFLITQMEEEERAFCSGRKK